MATIRSAKLLRRFEPAAHRGAMDRRAALLAGRRRDADGRRPARPRCAGRPHGLDDDHAAIGRPMAKEPPPVTELRKAAEVTDQDIDAAVDAVLADLATEA
ncbi:hypothetical protein ME121_6620 [Methylobacterium sp. ME121]|nr:hypothetical protein ME121_6620 [Methylobacterium sp. ME121]